MSWISENYEKASLGGAVLIAVGLGFFGWQSLTSVEDEFSDNPRGSGNDNPAIENGDRVAIAISSFEIERDWTKGDYKGRPVDLFTGIPLFVNKNDQSNPVDLPESDEVHPPIPNQWWLDNRIDPGFADSPQRDEDGDGFSNLEEFKAKTDPSDKSSYPNLIHKLKYVNDDSVEWVLRPGFPNMEGEFTFEYSDDAGRKNRVGATNPIQKGGLLFGEDPMKERFKYIDFEKKKEMNERIRAEVEVTVVSVEDQKPNKKGKIYQIPAMFKRNDARLHSHFDRTAVFSLEALDAGGQEFKVEEMTKFSIPKGADKLNLKLTQITSEQVTIVETLEDGTSKTYQITKGNIGPIEQ
jgi:hypothetical protein